MKLYVGEFMGVWKLKRLFLLVMLLYAFFLCACEESSADENEVSDTITENIYHPKPPRIPMKTLALILNWVI